jgi:hypothetical protein
VKVKQWPVYSPLKLMERRRIFPLFTKSWAVLHEVILCLVCTRRRKRSDSRLNCVPKIFFRPCVTANEKRIRLLLVPYHLVAFLHYLTSTAGLRTELKLGMFCSFEFHRDERPANDPVALPWDMSGCATMRF